MHLRKVTAREAFSPCRLRDLLNLLPSERSTDVPADEAKRDTPLDLVS